MTMNLDFTNALQEAEKASRCAARLVVSEEDVLSGITKQGPNMGNPYEMQLWVQEWEVLDREQDFTYKNRLTVPKENQRGYSRTPWFKVLKAFAELGIKGKSVTDFMNIECVIQETDDGRGYSFWLPIAKYVPGMSVEECVAQQRGVDIPINTNGAKESEEIEDSFDYKLPEDEDLAFVVRNTIGKSHASAVRFLSRQDKVKENDELLNSVKSGAIFDTLMEDGFLKEVDEKYEGIAVN